jgi:hypothetical protein
MDFFIELFGFLVVLGNLFDMLMDLLLFLFWNLITIGVRTCWHFRDGLKGLKLGPGNFDDHSIENLNEFFADD